MDTDKKADQEKSKDEEEETTLYKKSQKICEENLTFQVTPHPIIATEEFKISCSSPQAQKMWMNKLTSLRNLNQVAANGEIDKLKIPTLSLKKKPAIWWTKDDDLTLLKGTYKHGYGKFKEMQEDEEFKWSPSAITEKCNKIKAEDIDDEKSVVLWSESDVESFFSQNMWEKYYNNFSDCNGLSLTEPEIGRAHV